MMKVAKKEKINYLKPSSKTNIINAEDIIYSNDYQNTNSNNNDINTTLSNISNQLRNIALLDKNKEQKLLNSSFRVTNRTRNINSFFDNINIDTNRRFHNLQNKKVFDMFFPKNINYENFSSDEIQKENLELKENIKFLLKQIKKYQKSGLTIEDMDVNREQKMEKLEQEISILKKELNNYKNQLLVSQNNNEELKAENLELKEYINNLNNKELHERKNKFYEKYLDEVEENNLKKFNGINNYAYKNKIINNNKKNDNEEEENDNNSNSKLSDELLYDINKELLEGKHFEIKNKNKSYLSEGKLYTRKNVVKNLSFNYEPNNINIFKQKNKSNKKFTYSKNFLKNK